MPERICLPSLGDPTSPLPYERPGPQGIATIRAYGKGPYFIEASDTLMQARGS